MIDDVSTIWQTKLPRQFVEVLLSMNSKSDMQNFLRDVLTDKEIIEISARLEAARMLASGEKYTAITAKTKLSSRTVARISDWLQNGCNGYQAALKTLQHSHTPPARAE